MTRAEAIKKLLILHSCTAINPKTTVNQSDRNAIDMAITALREQEQREWISVNERLPEHGINVLVCDAREDYIGIWSLEHDVDDGDCWNDSGGWWQSFDEVTHWMPLPEPPKED